MAEPPGRVREGETSHQCPEPACAELAGEQVRGREHECPRRDVEGRTVPPPRSGPSRSARRASSRPGRRRRPGCRAAANVLAWKKWSGWWTRACPSHAICHAWRSTSCESDGTRPPRCSTRGHVTRSASTSPRAATRPSSPGPIAEASAGPRVPGASRALTGAAELVAAHRPRRDRPAPARRLEARGL